MANRYRFKAGDKVRICVGPANRPSLDALAHNGEVVTIKDRWPFDYAYHLEELPDLWGDGCFELDAHTILNKPSFKAE